MMGGGTAETGGMTGAGYGRDHGRKVLEVSKIVEAVVNAQVPSVTYRVVVTVNIAGQMRF